ncbi:hypothetical protein D9M68_718990 [compost metagenome]
MGHTRQLGQRRHIVIPDSLGSDRREQLRQIVRRALEVAFQHPTQLPLLFRQTNGKPLCQLLLSTHGKTGQAALHLPPGLLQLTRQALGISLQTCAQVGHQGRHRAARQGHSHEHLHQKGNPQSQKNRTQQATAQQRQNGGHSEYS